MGKRIRIASLSYFPCAPIAWTEKKRTKRDKNKSNKKETSKYFPTTIIFLTSKKKIEFHAHTTRSWMVVLFIFAPSSFPCCLLWSPPIACAFSFHLHSPALADVFFSSFVRCYFDAINRILFTMCSNRKMFSNKFMAMFVRFHGRFTLYVYFFYLLHCEIWQHRHRVSMCRHAIIKI